MGLWKKIGQKALFTLDAETAHGLSINALKLGIVPNCSFQTDDRLICNVAGLRFSNPIGMAAGFDKNGEVPDALLRLGFGYSEVGTVTPKPQAGNPKPRIFRLVKEHGVINRLGFNNQGHEAVYNRLQLRFENKGIVGINIGANKDSDDFIADYVLGIEKFSDLASYFTINISSPNTPGLRNLQTEEALETLLVKVFEASQKQVKQPPVFLKLAPDLQEDEIEKIAKVINRSNLSGVMVSNTTLSRSGVSKSKNSQETGGLSGSPLFIRSTIIMAKFRQCLDPSIPIIGIGGISDAITAWQKIEAGANLVQLYSCMVYEGPQIARNICAGLISRMDREKISHINDVCGSKTDFWASKSLET